MEAAESAILSLSDVTMKKTVMAVGPKKPKAKNANLVHPSRRKTLASKAKTHGGIPQWTTRYFGYVFLNSAGTNKAK
jgi:hypothetical protein